MSLVEIALSQYETKYKPLYADDLGLVIPAGSNWCGLFLGWCMAQLQLEIPEQPHVARKYLKIGEPTESPEVGDIVVFWRVSKNSWQGHVGIFVKEDSGKVYSLGGNQRGYVNITAYDAKKVLGFRKVF